MARRENVKLQTTDEKTPKSSFSSVVCAIISWYFAAFFFPGGLASFPDYSSAICFSIPVVLLPLKAWRVVLRKIGVYGLSKFVFAVALVLSLDRTFTPSFRITAVSFAALFSCYRAVRDRKREDPDEHEEPDEFPDEHMEHNGYIGSFQGSAPRRILISREQWEKIRGTVHHESPAPPIDTAQIIRDEENWRRERMGLSPIEYELQKVDGMEGRAFEEWCADLLRGNGFSSVKVTPASGDQGVDITATKDGLTYAVQCKRYASDLGNAPIQEVVAGKAFYRCNVAAVMTNQHFTSGAKDLASVNGVLLWDRETIIDMLKQEKSEII